MQRSSQNERVKSVNLLAHLAPDKRRHKPTTSTAAQPNTEEHKQRQKMVQDSKKVETGILIGEI